MRSKRQGAEAGDELGPQVFARLSLAQFLSALIGAIVVFAFLVVFIPGFGDAAEFESLLVRNGVILIVYLAGSFWVGARWGRRRFAPVAGWLGSGRPATDEDRARVLGIPMNGTVLAAAGWGGAAFVFTLANLDASVTGALTTGATILLGGATTCALAYLLFERILRPVTARALAGGPPPRPVGPGVSGRLVMAWLLGTGVPALGIAGAAAAHVAGADVDHDQVIYAALFLSLVVLGVGLMAVRLAARSVAEPVGGMRDALGRIGRGELEARVRIEDGSEVGLLQAGFNQMAAGLGERERIREAFGTYVDRDVAEHILREGTSLTGEEVEVTVMFIDVRDFTGFAERASASEVVATVNRLFERAVPIIQAHRGHVDKFVGDGLLAVFGAPRRQADHADQALAAAIEIERAVREVFGGELGVGIGLNSGMVVAGNVGGAGRLEFSVIGDAVNVAARVEAATRRTGDVILIAARTRELLRGSDVPLAERPNVALKGKREAVSLYTPKEPRATARL